MRHGKKHKRKIVIPWPDDAPPPDAVAPKVVFIGSAEHKDAWSPLFQPALRSDASRCPKELSDQAANTDRLRAAILAGCIGGGFEEGFPKYAWVWIGDGLWEARHIRGPSGTYKAYGPLEEAERPRDPEGVLDGARRLP